MKVLPTFRNSYLDVLRGLAIVGVVGVHSGQLLSRCVEVNSNFLNFLAYGKYGVEVFFFVSGCLLADIYGRTSVRLGKRYYLKRIVRIYPLWIVFLLINLLLQILLWQRNKPNFIDHFGTPGQALTYAIILGATFTLFVNPHLWNGVIPGGWSIQAEVGHYLLFPFLKKFGILSVSFVLIIVNICTWSISKSVLIDDLNSTFSKSGVLIGRWLRLGLYNTFTFFLIGIIFTYISKEFRGRSFSSQSHKRKTLDSMVFASLLISLGIVPCPFGNSLEALFYLVFNLIAGFLILRVNLLTVMLCKIGKVSYFIYFCHFLVLRFASYFVGDLCKIENQSVLIFCVLTVTMGISFLLAIFSMRYIENPFMLLVN